MVNIIFPAGYNLNCSLNIQGDIFIRANKRKKLPLRVAFSDINYIINST
jgi:hypothetical protein